MYLIVIAYKMKRLGAVARQAGCSPHIDILVNNDYHYHYWL